jgi:copper(I)-binding protein
MNRRRLLPSIAAVAGLAMTPFARAVMTGPIEILGAWAHASGTAQEITAYLTLINHSTEPDWLVGVRSSRAARAELRKMI